MSIALGKRRENQRTALRLMLRQLGDRAFDTALFSPGEASFSEVQRTTWQELSRIDLVHELDADRYRLTAKGWLAALESSQMSRAAEYESRLGKLLGAMKAHVKGRKKAAVIPLDQLASESGEPQGWIFNVVESGSTSTARRTGAGWYNHEKGRLVEIPVDFDLEPADITAALTTPHLVRIQLLEERVETLTVDREQFHCPYCDAPLSQTGRQDFPEHHCTVTYETFECGYCTADGFEEAPCPCGPNWPPLEEFSFETKHQGSLWLCQPRGRTNRARYKRRSNNRPRSAA